MIKIRINSSISRINDVPLAFQFEELALPYFRSIQNLTANDPAPKSLKKIYLMFVFDPSVPHGELGISIGRYSQSKKEVEVIIDIHRSEFSQRDESNRLKLIAGRLVDALHVIKSRLTNATSDIESLIQTVESFHISRIPGYVPLAGDNRARGIHSDKQSEDVAIVAPSERVQFQLVIQCDEWLFQKDDTVQHIEKDLSDLLGENAVVDGHDVGCGKLNFFVLCHDPTAISDRIKPLLCHYGVLDNTRIAYTKVGEDAYTVCWPPTPRQHFDL